MASTDTPPIRVVGRLALVGAAVCLSTVSVTAPASAHGDERLVGEQLVLEAGDSASFPGDVHYHRLVGRIVSDGPVTVRFAPATRSAGTADPTVHVLEVGPGTDLRFNELIRCCDDDGWTPYVLTIENAGEHAMSSTASVGLVHDDLAVMIDGAESGTRSSLVIMGLGWLALVWRAARRPRSAVPLRRPVIGLAALTAIVLGLGRSGARSYGEGGIALVAGASDLPVIPVNPLVSRASLMLAASMVLWAVIGLWWTRARPSAHRGWWYVVGAALLGMVGWATIRMMGAYDDVTMPAVWAGIAVAPLVWVLITDRASAAGASPRTVDAAPVVPRASG